MKGHEVVSERLLQSEVEMPLAIFFQEVEAKSASVVLQLCRCVLESVLTYSIATWKGNCRAMDRNVLLTVVRNH